MTGLTGLAGLCVATLVLGMVACAVAVARRRSARDGTRHHPVPHARPLPDDRPGELDSSCVDAALRRVLAVEVLAPPVTPRYLPVVLRYDLIDPYAVRAEFQLPGGTLSWVFARDLLRRGLRTPTGDGDVRIWPVDEKGVRLTLLSPDGEALIQTDASGVGDFLRQTYALCPDGREGDHLDVDAVVRSMLAS